MKANENPFRSSNVEQIRYALGRIALSQLADTSMNLGLCCILGPHGTGKTTLLEDLEPLLQERGRSTQWVRLNLDSTQQQRKAALKPLSELNSQSVCLFDGAEVLSRWQQVRLHRMARKQDFGLIATVHQKNALPILHRTEPDWQLAKQLVHELAQEHCSRDLIRNAQLAFDQSGGNVREVFRACYWQLAH